jgi:hypothetical protein
MGKTLNNFICAIFKEYYINSLEYYINSLEYIFNSLEYYINILEYYIIEYIGTKLLIRPKE